MKILIKKDNGRLLDSSKITERELESLSFDEKRVLYGWERCPGQTEYPRQTKLAEFMEI